MGRYKEVKPSQSLVWSRKSIYVLCDASSLFDVVGKLEIFLSLCFELGVMDLSIFVNFSSQLTIVIEFYPHIAS